MRRATLESRPTVCSVDAAPKTVRHGGQKKMKIPPLSIHVLPESIFVFGFLCFGCTVNDSNHTLFSYLLVPVSLLLTVLWSHWVKTHYSHPAPPLVLPVPIAQRSFITAIAECIQQQQ
ncbi:hypothetical protein TRVL_04881 [Trypanosoma vivax]|uniref:Uncharacterized protein n=1 Tax=Trypanosoma vivax (strain Y486) TaxID=1055687 RepID=G0U9L9_TRYVY|nr:hypothetical protein TRVL_04881 [Trypanosoma vivax]CCC54305.1 hypothetical protein TVY486_1117900 [Trypanosoma vivax Y486]